MAQQMVNGSRHDGSITITNRMSDRYAVVSEPFMGKHLRPQDAESKRLRKKRWHLRNNTDFSVEQINRMLRRRTIG